MGTMVVRAALAGAFLATAGTLGGVQAWPGPAGPAAHPTMPVPHMGSPAAMPGEGWLTRVLVRSCEHSLAATRRDQGAARDRRRECERDHRVAHAGRD